MAFVAIAAAFALAALLIRPLRTPLDAEPHTLAAAAGLVGRSRDPRRLAGSTPTWRCCWLPPRTSGCSPRAPRARRAPPWSRSSRSSRWFPPLVAFGTVSAELDLGLAAPWHLLLMIVDGQIGLCMCLLWCAMLGGLIGCVSAANAFGGRVHASEASILGPGTHAGPGSLGATPSTLRGP